MSLLATLRDATKDAHASIERHVPLMGASVSEDTYATYLATMLGFHAPIEDALARLPASFATDVALSQRTKSDALREDIAALGRAQDVPRCPRLPDVSDVDRAYGALYVLEGSTLGAAVIARHLASHLDIGRCARFLSVYGARSGAMWRAFCDALDAHGARPETDEGAVVDAALETFSTLEAWLVANGEAS